ncbi:TonB family protein [bacterium]|nr:TonB family protein [bacterium]
MNKQNSFRNFIIASILVHISIVGLLLFTSSFQSQNKTENIEIAFLDPNEVKKLNKPEPVNVVDSDSANANNELSENAKYLSEKSNTVKQETKAKSGEKFHNAKAPAKQAQKAVVAKAETKANKPDFFAKGFDAYAALNKKQEAQQQREVAQQKGSNDASTTNDSLANVKDDLITRLNTKEYKYFGYYSRIKTQLNQWWVPKVQQKFTKMLRQGRTIASEDNKITKLVITLNDVGNLVNVQVLAESGVRDLDDAAIEAFRSAAPFPNPPKGMVESDGTVKIRWDCVVES